MKALVILRHGKAELHRFDLDDFDRDLTDRGMRNAFDMGKYISDKIGLPDLVLTSSAKRAHRTALLAAEGMAYPQDKVKADEDLYFAPPKWILKVLSELPDNIKSCVLVGHNPGLTDLINDLGVRLDNLPTASAACFDFAVESWKDIAADNAEFRWIQLAREL